jgi:hypothetical protein
MSYSQLSRDILSAFLLALSRQDQPCPPSLQKELHALGLQIQANSTLLEQPMTLLNPLLHSHPTLQSAYDLARLEIENNSINRDGPSEYTQGDELINSVKKIFTDIDPIIAANRLAYPSTSIWQKIQQIFSNFANRIWTQS